MFELLKRGPFGIVVINVTAEVYTTKSQRFDLRSGWAISVVRINDLEMVGLTGIEPVPP